MTREGLSLKLPTKAYVAGSRVQSDLIRERRGSKRSARAYNRVCYSTSVKQKLVRDARVLAYVSIDSAHSAKPHRRLVFGLIER